MAKRNASPAPTRRQAASKPKATKSTRPKVSITRTSPETLTIELEAAHRRIRDLEELHRKVGQRLDAAIDTIHKILGHSA